jgi:hypothetical protein
MRVGRGQRGCHEMDWASSVSVRQTLKLASLTFLKDRILTCHASQKFRGTCFLPASFTSPCDLSSQSRSISSLYIDRSIDQERQQRTPAETRYCNWAAMASPSSPSCKHRMLLLALLILAAEASSTKAAAYLYDDLKVTWGSGCSYFYMDGGDVDTLALCLDRSSGSGFGSNGSYLYARYDMDIKLVANDSAGTVATFYVSTPTPCRAAARLCLVWAQ